jgi:RNA polymerase sigma factor (sigma-70 family)
MGMRPRLIIIEMFSTFIKLKAGGFGDWIPDSNLRQSMQSCLDSKPDQSDPENFWVKHWHELWQEHKTDLARMHLFAYLQEPMYWAAGQILKKFTSPQRNLEDYFQDSHTYCETVLNKFNPEAGILKSFAGTVLLNALRNHIREQGEAALCTEWSLLRRVGKKRLLEALEQQGLTKAQISQYCLAWKCFKEVYVPQQGGGTNRLPEPTPQHWESIANIYNRERLNLSPPSQSCTATIIKQWLLQIERIVRKYWYSSPTTDLDVEAQLPDPSDSLVTQWIAAEDDWLRKNQQTQIYDVLIRTISSLKPEWKLVLKLYYCQYLTLDQIAKDLNKPYSWVQRRVHRAETALLLALVDWGQSCAEVEGGVNIPPTPNQVNNKSAVLKQWLKIRNRELESHLS